MMYLVSTFAAGAAAIELRNLAVDSTNNKIEFNGHGFADGDIVLASANIGGTATAAKMYVVDGKTTNDFKLKSFKATDASGETAVEFSDATGGAATLSKYGAKKCKIASTEADDNKVTCAAAPNLALSDELRIYCTSTAGNDCKLDSTTNAKLANGKAVWPREVGAALTAFTLSDAKPTDATTAGGVIAIASDGHADTANKVWLLSKDTGSVYAAAPKTLAADGGKWDVGTTYGGSATAAIAVCGNAECGVSDGTAYYYTAGSAATTGLTDKNVYYIDGGKGHATPYSFKVNAVVATAATLTEGTAVNVTGSGNGDTWQRIDAGYRMTGSTATDNKIHIEGNNVIAENTGVIFWCSATTTAADCDYKLAGGSNGASFKVKGTHAHDSGTTKGALKASSGADGCTTACPDVAVSADTASKTKGYLLKKNAEVATVFPAAAAGSAARSFAMLGSAVAMATAFLLA